MPLNTIRHLDAVLLFAALASLLLGLGAPLFDLDEGAFSEATREMLARGDFISTYLNGNPRYDKPILIYWLQALSVSTFGLHEFALRLPSALSALGWTLLTYLFVQRALSPSAGAAGHTPPPHNSVHPARDTALAAAVMTASSLAVLIIGRAATADALLNLLIAATMFVLWLWIREGRRIWLYSAYAAMGLGFLTKGPVALLIPGAVSFLYFLSRRDLKSWLRFWFDWRGVLLCLAIALPWYLAQYLKEGDAFIEGFFLKHNVSRFGGAMEGHRGGPLYYVPVVLIGLLPYSAVFLALFRQPRVWWQNELFRFLFLWFLFVFVFFSLAATKLPHYLVYGQTGAVILMAVALSRLRSRFWVLLPAVLLFALCLTLPNIVQATLNTADIHYRLMLADAELQFSPLYRIYFGAALLMTLLLVVLKVVPLPRALLACGVAGAIGVSTLLTPTVSRLLQQPVKEAGLIARKLPEPVVMWGINMPSFSVYAERVTERRPPRPGETAFTTRERLAELPRRQILYAEKNIVLVRVLP